MRTRSGASADRTAYTKKLRRRAPRQPLAKKPAPKRKAKAQSARVGPPDWLVAGLPALADVSQHVLEQTRPVCCRSAGCTELTKITPYCKRHLELERNLAVRTSEIPNAGLGLFAVYAPGRAVLDDYWVRSSTRRGKALVFREGEVICEYDGRRVPAAQESDRSALFETGRWPWALELRDGTGAFVDASDTTFLGRWVNSATYTGRTPNAELNEDCKIVAKRDIFDGEEILGSYGTSWFSTLQRELAKAEQRPGGRLYTCDRREDVPVAPAVQARSERARRRHGRGGRDEEEPPAAASPPSVLPQLWVPRGASASTPSAPGQTKPWCWRPPPSWRVCCSGQS